MDQQYQQIPFSMSEFTHEYGDHVHLLANPYLQSLLAQFSTPAHNHPLLTPYVKVMYEALFESALNLLAPREVVKWDTRMKASTPKGVLETQVLAKESPMVFVDLARAGTVPAQVGFDKTCLYFKPELLRQDHFYVNRATNEAGEVTGVTVAGSKIGGGIENALVFFPDPMGATGGSLSFAVDHYKNQVAGKARAYASLHLIITPEYIKRLRADHPDLHIFALRLDRALSSERALKSGFGAHPEEERGLNDIQYIVPGAGGVGEILNNSFV